MKIKHCVLVVFFSIAIACLFRLGHCAKKMDLDDLKDMLKPMVKSCKSKTGVPEELIANIKDGVFIEDRKVMCYFRCLAVMLKLMNKKGEISLAGLNKQIDTLMKEDLIPRMKEIIKICFDRVPEEEDSCNYAFRLVICAYNEEPSMFFLP